ncbi:ABC transporter permease [Mucilaginibacter myungsuensis]|uniref:ABC transporter permease n=1 Tax=Mucilaginibacter myungsuensis TaxID=649104 RepID=A0A929PVT4_9SPHI|nr:ABC transporter permease [Mucilaginibacter myungsuensis]MBE9660650.1 ABC transporter permease [Mucilaginibacter myungsuensis]MDN3600695.1 ABC transporter permease [Mucilaginibacter myungsuensis]
MFKNYLKIAWRSLLRQKLYSLINIGGLAVGLCVCMLVMLYVAHEYSYDSFHNGGDRIFALAGRSTWNGADVNFANTSFGTGPVAKQNSAKVEGYMRIHHFDDGAIISTPQNPMNKFAEAGLISVDDNFLDFFNFKLLSGAPRQVLAKPNGIVLSADMARKYFGDDDPIGKVLNIGLDSTYRFEVTGVVQTMPSNTTVNYGLIIPNAALKNIVQTKDILKQVLPGSGDFKTYLQLNAATDTLPVKNALASVLKQNQASLNDKITFTQLPAIHVQDEVFGDHANIKYLKIFPLVAVLVLLLALVNYMSLATARASVRAKEVGVRKVNGAARSSIALQFYIESALYALISFALAYLLCYLVADKFMAILDLKIDTSFLYSAKVILIMAVLLALTVLIAGSYPAIVLSSFKPVITLKGSGQGSKGITVRKVFTTLQFATSVGLIICGIIINRQLFFFKNRDTGVNRENVLVVPVKKNLAPQYQSFKKEVSALAGVSSVASASIPLYSSFGIQFAKNNNRNTVLFSMVVDKAFIPQLNIKWKVPPVDQDAISTLDRIVINETAAAKLDIKGNPIGQTVDANRKFQIAGVIKDLNMNLLRDISPMCIIVMSDENLHMAYTEGYAYIKVKPNVNMSAMLVKIKHVYQQYDKESPFDYKFLDDVYNKQYKAEERLSDLFSYFMVVTIVLAALGLFGLAAFTIEQRTKEIGIRKVLGAGLASINGLLSIDFLKLVLLSIVIASPIAWWAMNKWLQNFQYRITIQWWVFAAAGLVAVVVALVAISYHSVKAALADPVKSLRNE